jgi:hypothetical protein
MADSQNELEGRKGEAGKGKERRGEGEKRRNGETYERKARGAGRKARGREKAIKSSKPKAPMDSGFTFMVSTRKLRSRLSYGLGWWE